MDSFLEEARLLLALPDRCPPDFPALTDEQVTSSQLAPSAIGYPEVHLIQVLQFKPIPLHVRVPEVGIRLIATGGFRVDHLAQRDTEVGAHRWISVVELNVNEPPGLR